MALSCTHHTIDTPAPELPFAPKATPRGRGTERMLQETTLAPRSIAPTGGPRTRLLSKITGTLGALRTVIQWQRSQAGIKGKKVPASARRKARQIFQTRCNTKTGRAVVEGCVPSHAQSGLSLSRGSVTP